MALRSVASSPAATSLIHPCSEISMQSTLIQLVGRLEAPIEERVLLWPWPYPADAQLCLPLLGKVFPCFPQLYTCRTCTLVINLQSSSLLYLNPGSSATHRQIIVSTTMVDTSLCTSECLDNKIPFVFFFGFNLCVLLAQGSSTCTCLPSTPCTHLPAQLPGIHPCLSISCCSLLLSSSLQ